MGTSSSSRSGFRRAGLAAAAAISAAASLAALAPRPQEPSSPAPRGVTIGVLRRDGFLTPFASYDNERWSSPWPDPSSVAALPFALDSVPNKWWGAGARAPWVAW